MNPCVSNAYDIKYIVPGGDGGYSVKGRDGGVIARATWFIPRESVPKIRDSGQKVKLPRRSLTN